VLLGFAMFCYIVAAALIAVALDRR